MEKLVPATDMTFQGEVIAGDAQFTLDASFSGTANLHHQGVSVILNADPATFKNC